MEPARARSACRAASNAALRDFAGQHRPIAAAAIHDHLGVGIGDQLLDVALEDPLAQVHRLRGVAIVPLGILTDVHENGLRICRQALASLLEGQLLYVRARFIDDF